MPTKDKPKYRRGSYKGTKRQLFLSRLTNKWQSVEDMGLVDLYPNSYGAYTVALNKLANLKLMKIEKVGRNLSSWRFKKKI